MATSSPNLAPTGVGERIDIPDVLRGCALLCIVVVNVAVASQPVQAVALDLRPWATIDRALAWLIRFFLEGKFYPLFSLLFGIGFALQMQRVEARRGRFGWLYGRIGYGTLAVLGNHCQTSIDRSPPARRQRQQPNGKGSNGAIPDGQPQASVYDDPQPEPGRVNVDETHRAGEIGGRAGDAVLELAALARIENRGRDRRRMVAVPFGANSSRGRGPACLDGSAGRRAGTACGCGARSTRPRSRSVR